MSREIACDGVAASKKSLRKLAEHELMSSDREMLVAIDVEAVVPIFVNILLGKERWEEIDECPTVFDAECAPDRNLTALAIIVEDLLRPRIHHERQWNAALG